MLIKTKRFCQKTYMLYILGTYLIRIAFRFFMFVTLENIVPESDTTNLLFINENSFIHKQEIVKLGSDSTNSRRFTHHFIYYSDYLMQASKYLQNEVVVDLGAGRNLSGFRLAFFSGAKSYIAVEPHHTQELLEQFNLFKFGRDANFRESLKEIIPSLSKNSSYDSSRVRFIQENMKKYLDNSSIDMPVCILQEDMLSSLIRLPSSSVSVLAGGIDRVILDDDVYAKSVESEISRVLSFGGTYVSAFSRFSQTNLNLEYKHSSIEIFAKK